MRLGLIGKHTLSAVWEENSLDAPLFERLAAGSDSMFIIGISASGKHHFARIGRIDLILVPRRRFCNTACFAIEAFFFGYRHIKRHGCDVIGASEPFGGGLSALALKALLGVPVLAMIQGNLLDLPRQHFSRTKSALIRGVTLFVARKADAVRAVSSRIARDLERAGTPKSKIFLLKNRVDLVRFDSRRLSAERHRLRSRWGWSPSTRALTFVGALTEQKGFPEFVGIAYELLSSGADIGVMVLGDGPLKAAAEAKLAGFGNRTRFFGFVSHAEIHKVLSTADIGCFFSHHEGMPRVVLEYMAMGLPIVATPVGGVGEVVVDTVSGFLVGVGDVRAMQERVTDLVENTTVGCRVGAAARKTVEEHHDLERTIQDQLAVYRMLAKKSDANPDSGRRAPVDS